MMAHGAFPTDRNLLSSAQFLHQELPIRLAHRVTELETLPHGLSTKPAVLKVCSLLLMFWLWMCLAFSRRGEMYMSS